MDSGAFNLEILFMSYPYGEYWKNTNPFTTFKNFKWSSDYDYWHKPSEEGTYKEHGSTNASQGGKYWNKIDAKTQGVVTKSFYWVKGKRENGKHDHIWLREDFTLDNLAGYVQGLGPLYEAGLSVGAVGDLKPVTEGTGHMSFGNYISAIGSYIKKDPLKAAGLAAAAAATGGAAGALAIGGIGASGAVSLAGAIDAAKSIKENVDKVKDLKKQVQDVMPKKQVSMPVPSAPNPQSQIGALPVEAKKEDNTKLIVGAAIAAKAAAII